MAAVWTRLNTLLLLLVLLGMIAMFAQRAAGGPLDPPSAPAPTDSVKLPGTPISQPASAADFPIVISTPGTYYLTSDIIGVVGKHGIVIAADYVTLDLMGQSVIGGPGVGSGITDEFVSHTDVTVRNGAVRGWTIGVSLQATGRVILEDLRVELNQSGVAVGSGGLLSRLVVRENSNGMFITNHASDFGTQISDSNISHNGSYGIENWANNVWVHDNVIDANGQDGIRLIGDASWNKVTDNRITGNGGYGVHINGDFPGDDPNVNLVARNALLGNVTAAVRDTGAGNRIGTFVGGDASITATNPWSNVVY